MARVRIRNVDSEIKKFHLSLFESWVRIPPKFHVTERWVTFAIQGSRKIRSFILRFILLGILLRTRRWLVAFQENFLYQTSSHLFQFAFDRIFNSICKIVKYSTISFCQRLQLHQNQHHHHHLHRPHHHQPQHHHHHLHHPGKAVLIW